jgi:hypothetical protein
MTIEDNGSPQTRYEQRAIALMESWQHDPVKYANEAINIGAMFPGGLSSQQKDALIQLRDFYEARRLRAFGEKLTPKQEKLAGKIGITLRAGQGPGKSFLGGIIAHWYLNCHYKALIPAFAPKAEQLKATLFKHLSEIIDHTEEHGSPLIKGKLKVQSDKVYHVDGGSNKYSWAAYIKTVQNVSGEGAKGIAAQGDHAKHMMILTEESSAKELDDIFPVIEGTIQSDPLNFIIMIGNPNRTSGYFYDSHTSRKDDWIALRWSNEECEFIPQEATKRLEAVYGRDDNFFRVRVLGEFPLQNSDSFFPQYAIDNMFESFDSFPDMDGRPVMSIDPAGRGKDKTIVAFRDNNDIGPIIQFHGKEEKHIFNEILSLVRDYNPCAVVIDNNGIGYYLYKWLQDVVSVPVYGISSHTAARNPSRFFRIRDELVFKMREPMMAGVLKVHFDRGETTPEQASKIQRDLREELSLISELEGAVTRFTDKMTMKRKLGRSPDIFDALWMSYFIDGEAEASINEQLDQYDLAWMDEDESNSTQGGWMSL